MKPPCEIIVRKVLPTLRSQIVMILSEKYEMKQIEIAENLGITQASVSQYLAASRAKDEFLKKSFPLFEEYAERIAERVAEEHISKMDGIILMCDLCRILRNSKKFCEMHQLQIELEECDMCRF
ncbi:MAG: transcriptional regulator [Candidatus Methanofastidiosia archaeon]